MDTAVLNPLRARRLEEGLSMREVARRAGCSLSMVQFIENDFTGYSPEMDRKIASVFGEATLEDLK